MPRNVEIKAEIKELHFGQFLSLAREISDTDEIVMSQQDTYYRVPEGRLKLREIENGNAELIFYKRPNLEGPKLSNYRKQVFNCTEEVKGLKETLKESLGELGRIKKKRHVFMVGQTRIHADVVPNIGHFMELEVMLKKEQSLEHGVSIADKLMSELNITSCELIQDSYIDMLLRKWPITV